MPLLPLFLYTIPLYQRSRKWVSGSRLSVEARLCLAPEQLGRGHRQDVLAPLRDCCGREGLLKTFRQGAEVWVTKPFVSDQAANLNVYRLVA
ncbi:hypothetical protein E2C01_050761 [Portunus trituberculatus]|uniref:Uncharacterized protein n=1 Tax=Portunus trituberculatus TaxID=210409 RepID=A0A5B7GJU1_PORTR|nr:hypothetical protein [Portunus trituberculatus]